MDLKEFWISILLVILQVAPNVLGGVFPKSKGSNEKSGEIGTFESDESDEDDDSSWLGSGSGIAVLGGIAVVAIVVVAVIAVMLRRRKAQRRGETRILAAATIAKVPEIPPTCKEKGNHEYPADSECKEAAPTAPIDDPWEQPPPYTDVVNGESSQNQMDEEGERESRLGPSLLKGPLG